MDWEYCKEILPKVSRTFALNIGQLEEDTYRAVLVGYLFFRIADTFEDNIYQTTSQKIASLNDFTKQIRNISVKGYKRFRGLLLLCSRTCRGNVE